ncbi:hypothetical protein J4410_04595 [Candidatus Woesearchaeota archaeon]|nr:hypothetical protein [Candidatus Woesearchaeota archaeon]
MKQQVENLANTLKKNGICATKDEALQKAREILHLHDEVEQLEQVEAYHEKGREGLQNEIQRLKKIVTEQEEEISQLKKEKKELEVLREQLEDEIRELQFQQ